MFNSNSGKLQRKVGLTNNTNANSNKSRWQNKPTRSNNHRGHANARKVVTVDPRRLIKKVVTKEELPVYSARNTFKDFALSFQLQLNITRKGYTLPTAIQDQAIPEIMQGKDVVGIANTGTGKTAAFLIPILDKVIKKVGEKALVVVPTRELALQIQQEFKSLAKFTNINSALFIGGTSMPAQLREARGRYEFAIGTPGRLKDMVNQGVLKLQDFSIVVLDEVDRMLDMGFIHDIKFLIAKFPEKKHSLFFSATINSEIERLIRMFAKDPVTITVKTGETSANVNQDVIKVHSPGEKIDELQKILDSLKQPGQVSKAIVFVRTKRGADKLDRILQRKGYKVGSLHGDKRQHQRTKTIRDFKEGRIFILVATDVAARGLDIADVAYVVNFDLPATYDDYVHRIGRTGRGDKIGHAVSLVME